jgi:cysteine dioxygenase
MSTDITQSTELKAPHNVTKTQLLSFNNLVKKLLALDRAPTLIEINKWMSEVEVNDSDLRPHLGFKAGGYSRHRVALSDYAELLVLCWRPGQRTPIHDHNGSFGAVRVCRGIMWETVFSRDDELKLRYQSGREWHPNDVTGADIPDIHQIGNPDVSGVDLVTLHLYAPPLGVLNTYRVGSSEIGHYNVDEFMDGAGI